MIRATALLLILSLGAARAEDPLFFTSLGDPQMASAIAAARAGLDLFLDHALDKDGISGDGSFIKAGIPTPGQDIREEYFWFSPFRALPDGRFAGLSLNDGIYAPQINERHGIGV